MGWLNFLENSFGTKDKNRKKFKDGTKKPGKFEASLIERAKRKSSKIKEPLEYLEDRIIKTRIKDEKRHANFIKENSAGFFEGGNFVGDPNNDAMRALELSSEKYYEAAFERLVRMKYISKDPEAKEKQMQSLLGWINYLKGLTTHNENTKFTYYVLRSVLKYDLYWLDKNEDGSWKTGIRDKNTKKEFPIFDPDITPEVLSEMRDELAYLELEDGPKTITNMIQQNLSNFHPESPFFQAIKIADFRELYFLLKEKIELGRIKDEDIESREEGMWLPVFSYKNKKQVEKAKIAYDLSKATEYSRGFCLKSPLTADEYLQKGDIYLYNIPTIVKTKDGKGRKVNIPEIAIQVLHNGEINKDEVHGNAPNQGIKPKYLSIAKEFIINSKFKNKEEFEMGFSDAEFLENLDTKMSRGEEPNGRELKFLYQIYRPVKTFEINNGEQKAIGELKLGRNPIHDFMKMFEVSLDEMALNLKNISKKTKVFIGNINIINLKSLENIQEITGKIYLDAPTRPDFFKNLKKVKGIEINEHDRIRLSENFFKKFPEDPDARLKKVFY